MVKRDVIGLVEHGSGVRVVGMTGGNVNIVKCWNSNSMGTRGYAKEGWELTPMSSFDIEQGGVNSESDSRGVPEGVRTDGPGFSLCAAPLESSGPGFGGVGQRLGK